MQIDNATYNKLLGHTDRMQQELLRCFVAKNDGDKLRSMDKAYADLLDLRIGLRELRESITKMHKEALCRISQQGS